MNNSNPEVRIFFNYNKDVGAGHLRRSLTLADELRKRQCSVELRNINSQADDQFIPSTYRLPINPQIVVFDCGAGLIGDIENLKMQKIKSIGLDYSGDQEPDLVISVFEHTQPLPIGRRLSGFDYILVRPDVRSLKSMAKTNDGSALVLLGGGDFLGQSAEAAQFLEQLGFQVNLVYGPLANPKNIPQSKNIQIHKNPDNLVELMANCKLAVCNGGGSLFELAFLAKPVVALPQTLAEKNLIEVFLQKNAILGTNLNCLENLNESVLSKVAKTAESLIDGNGVERIANLIIEESKK